MDNVWIAPIAAIIIGILHVVNQWLIARYNKRKDEAPSPNAVSRQQPVVIPRQRSIGRILFLLCMFVICALLLLWQVRNDQPLTRLAVFNIAMYSTLCLHFFVSLAREV